MIRKSTKSIVSVKAFMEAIKTEILSLCYKTQLRSKGSASDVRISSVENA